MTAARPCIFGEVLFDHFPDGVRVLGGAPFNVAWHLQAFGQAPHFVSRVGADTEGDQVRRAMRDWGMDISGLQTDPELPTGRVVVEFSDGEPHYDIVEPCAYDAIQPTPAADFNLLYHGSLALLGDVSRHAVAELKAHGAEIVFVDVNLRPPWWNASHLHEMLKDADWVKLNTDELALLQPDIQGSDAAERFLEIHDLHGLVLTHGADGAEILTKEGARFSARPEPTTRVVDTVGAGDAFTSVTILGMLNGWPLDLTLQRAQQFASAIVGLRGATVAERGFYAPYLDLWKTVN